MKLSKKRWVVSAAVLLSCVGISACSDDSSGSSGKPADPCANKVCGTDQVCVDGTCEAVVVDLCANVSCESDETCYSGACYDTACLVDGLPMVCGEGKQCVKGSCEETACIGKTCPDGKACLGGSCLDEACIVDGAEKACGENEMCVKGECIDDGCLVDGSPMVCDPGWECIKGTCEETACLDKDCPEGQSCTGGTCVDNECLAISCDAGMTCVKGDCILDACVGTEPCLQGKVCVVDGSCQFETAPAIVAQIPENLTTDENGLEVVIPVSLNNEPAEDVQLVCEIKTESANVEAIVDCSSIVFNAENWNDVQSIVVTGAADYMIDDDQNYKLIVRTESSDPEFDGLVLADIEMINKDVNTAGLIVEIIGASTLTTSEDGTTAEFSVKLNSKPSEDVVVHVKSDNTSEGVVSTEEFTFTSENWNEPQTITVTGVNDDVADGTQEYNIELSTSSNDVYYEGVTANVEAYNIDNDVAGVSVLVSSIETDENGQKATIPVRLNSKPTSNVTIAVVVSDGTEAEANVVNVTFTPDNYDTVQNIVISGVKDNIVDGDQNYTVSLNVSSADVSYNSLAQESIIINGTNKDRDIGDVSATPGAAAVVTEAGSTVDVEYVLTAIPEDVVEVSLSVSDSTELSVLASSLKFDKTNWDVPQTVAVKGVDDHIIDGPIVSDLNIVTSSKDKNFDGKKHTISFTTLDDDTAGLIVNSTKASLLESDGTASFTVVLSAEPSQAVTISFASSDITELVVESPESLKFDASNWNVPQTVKLKAVDDTKADGTQTAHISLKSSSEDTLFDGLAAQTVDYEILDNETVSVVLALGATTLKPDALTTTLSVSLSTEPIDDVTVTVSTTNDVTAALGKKSFVFTPSDWNKAQSTSITNTAPQKATSAITVEKFAGVASSKGAYNMVKSNEASIKIYAFVSRNFEYKGSAESTELLPGKYKLQVWGAAGGVTKSDWAKAGPGGYAEGVLELKKATTVYAVVGGRGFGSQCKSPGVDGGGGGFNGGGASYNTGWGGGGGTDIRLLKNDLYNRVIVAGGGGGGALDYYSTIQSYKGNGGYGGGETGGSATGDGGSVVTYAGATQTSGYAFGVGQNAYNYYQCGSVPYGGGGGGWYGGYARDVKVYAQGTGGSGGSGYVNTSTSTKPAGYALSSSEYFLTSTKLIGGNLSMPSVSGDSETGHLDAGYARITVVE